MTIKSILVEVEDEYGRLKKVLFSDFKNIRGNNIDIYTETHDYKRYDGNVYCSQFTHEHDIKINLKCSEYVLTEMKGE